VKIRFDAAEAISELSRLNLISEVGTGYKVRGTDEAFHTLEEHWGKLLLQRKEAVHGV